MYAPPTLMGCIRSFIEPLGAMASLYRYSHATVSHLPVFLQASLLQSLFNIRTYLCF